MKIRHSQCYRSDSSGFFAGRWGLVKLGLVPKLRSLPSEVRVGEAKAPDPKQPQRGKLACIICRALGTPKSVKVANEHWSDGPIGINHLQQCKSTLNCDHRSELHHLQSTRLAYKDNK